MPSACSSCTSLKPKVYRSVVSKIRKLVKLKITLMKYDGWRRFAKTKLTWPRCCVPQRKFFWVQHEFSMRVLSCAVVLAQFSHYFSLFRLLLSFAGHTVMSFGLHLAWKHRSLLSQPLFCISLPRLKQNPHSRAGEHKCKLGTEASW